MAQRVKISEEQFRNILRGEQLGVVRPEEADFYRKLYYDQALPPIAYCSYYDAGSCELAAKFARGSCLKNPQYRKR
jgi:hypothetical protein